MNTSNGECTFWYTADYKQLMPRLKNDVAAKRTLIATQFKVLSKIKKEGHLNLIDPDKANTVQGRVTEVKRKGGVLMFKIIVGQEYIDKLTAIQIPVIRTEDEVLSITLERGREV